MNPLSLKFSLRLTLIVFAFLFTQNSIARSNKVLEDFYKERLVHINQTLKKRQSDFQASKALLANYVDETLLPLWGSAKTLTGLLGKSAWKSVAADQQQQFKQAFDDTIQRYVQEGFSQYDGQTVEFVSLRLNKKKSRGLLSLKIHPNLLPSFQVDLKIFRQQTSFQQAGQNWLVYDLLFQGVSYISLKKSGFRQLLQEQGAVALLTSLQEKNKGFIGSNRSLQVGAKNSAEISLTDSIINRPTDLP